jgi:D-alanyl-D-alanine carboxypeptidase
MRAVVRFACVLGGAFCALLAIGAGAAETPAGEFTATTQYRILAAVRHDLAEYGGKKPIPGVVLGIWYPDHGSFVKGIGNANLSPPIPMEIDDKFRIGSNTKTFVVTVLLQLVDEGKLSLDDPVSKFALSIKVPNGEHVTVRQLMQMRSGIIDLYANPAFQSLHLTANSAFNRKPYIQWALDHPPLFPPGTKWNYSNTNYMLLGMIAEVVGHERISEQVQRRLLSPLGLRNTSFYLSDPTMPIPYAHGFELDAHKNWVDTTVVLPPAVSWAAGAMVSDTGDMKKWVKAYVTGTTNSAATQKERLTCLSTGTGNLRFGLGVGCSAGWYGYTGGITGYNTAAYYLPSKGATIIAFVNSQQEPHGKPDVANAIFRDVARIVFPRNVPFQI